MTKILYLFKQDFIYFLFNFRIDSKVILINFFKIIKVKNNK
jgi:hypothetical protein